MRICGNRSGAGNFIRNWDRSVRCIAVFRDRSHIDTMGDLVYPAKTGRLRNGLSGSVSDLYDPTKCVRTAVDGKGTFHTTTIDDVKRICRDPAWQGRRSDNRTGSPVIVMGDLLCTAAREERSVTEEMCHKRDDD